MKTDATKAKSLHGDLGTFVAYAPWWARILSAVAFGLRTMIGYKRTVTRLGERLGMQHLVPTQGAAAELVAAVLIRGAGVTRLPVSTTHVVTSGIGRDNGWVRGGLQGGVIGQIMWAWVLTLPATWPAVCFCFDLPLNFHPIAIRACLVDTPFGADGATGDRRSWLGLRS